MLTDRYQHDTTEHEAGSRFDPNSMKGANYFRRQYWNNAYFDALDVIRSVAKKLGMTTAGAASRWASHHSMMKKEYDDAVITGASSATQLEENLANLEKGPLPEEMVKAFDDGWEIVKEVCGPYFQVMDSQFTLKLYMYVEDQLNRFNICTIGSSMNLLVGVI